MPYLTEAELIKTIRKGDIRSVYFFWGKDVASAENIAKKLRDKLLPKEQRDLNYHFITAADFSASELSDIAEALPVFADRTVTFINDLNVDNLKKDEQDALLKAISDLDPETSTFIFYTTGVDLAAGKKALTPKNKKLCDHISKYGGIVTEFQQKKPNELVNHIQSRLTPVGCFMSPKNAEYLASLQNSSILMIDNELDKLSAYVGSGEITKEVIDLLVSDQLETDAYKLSRAVLSGKSSEAFKTLDKLYSRQTEPIALLSVISGSFIDLYRAKTAVIGGYSQNDVVNDFTYRGREFAVKNAFRDCMSIPLEKIRYGIGILSQCDINMKSKRTDPKILLEEAISKILSYRR